MENPQKIHIRVPIAYFAAKHESNSLLYLQLRRTVLTISVARSNINDTMKEFHCSYCKGQGHFMAQCLKCLTKNCSNGICRDYNRFHHSECEFNNACVYKRQHICSICNSVTCKAYHLVNSSPNPNEWLNLPKKNTELINNLVKIVQKISEIVNIQRRNLPPSSDKRNQDNIVMEPTATNKQDTSSLETKQQDTSRGILGLPVVSAQKQLIMPVSTGFPMSCVSLTRPKEIIDKYNKASIAPLHSSNISLTMADGAKLTCCGTINAPLTFEDNNTFTFQMLVIPDLPVEIVFGNNHLSKTDAEICPSMRTICFRLNAMNSKLNCKLINSSNSLFAYTSVIDNT